MSHDTPYELGTRRARWTEILKGLLKDADVQQKEVASEIAAPTGNPRNPEVSEFVNGKPETLRRWFEAHSDWVDVFGAKVGRTRADLRHLLEEVRRGTEASATPWHPAFPSVRLEEVEIDAVFEEGRSAKDCRKPPVPEAPMVIVGPAGATREIAVRQLAAIWSGPVTGLERATQGSFTVRLGSWGPEQVVTLAEKLAGATGLEPEARQRLRDFGAAVHRHPALAGPVRSPGLAVALLEQVALRGPPTSPKQAREHLSRGAWVRASRFDEHLQVVDERLLEELFAELARRARGPDEVGRWHAAPRREVERIVAERVRDRYGVDRAKVVALAREAAEHRKPKDRERALEGVEKALAHRDVDRIVDALFIQRVLEPIAHTHAESVRAVEPVLAAVWAARGLKGELPPIGDGDALVDPDRVLLVEELAMNGLSATGLAEALREVPAALALDAARWLVHHAAVAPPAVEELHPDVRRAWAALTWHLARPTWPVGAGYRWYVPAREGLRHASWILRDHLPSFGEDPVADLRTHIEGGPSEEPPSAEQVRWLAIGQNRVDTPEARTWWQRHDPSRGVHRLVQGAERGEPSCLRVLGGRERSDRLWSTLSLEDRIGYARRFAPADADAGEAWWGFAGERGHTQETLDRLAEWAEEVGGDVMEASVADGIRPHLGGGYGLHEREWWFRLAVRLRLREVLREVADPHWLDGATIDGRAGLEWRLRTRSHSLALAWDDVGERRRTAKLGLGDVVADRDMLGLSAAEALYDLGEPDPLLARWRSGLAAYPEELVADVERLQGLRTLLGTRPNEWVLLPRIPHDRDAASSRLEERRAELAAYTSRQLLEPGRALDHLPWVALSALDHVGLPFVDPTLQDAVLGAYALALDLPPTLPEGLDGWLRSLSPLGRPRGGGTWEAFEALLKRRDPHVLRAWLDRPLHGDEEARKVEEQLGIDGTLLTEVWHMTRDRADRAKHREWLARRADLRGDAHPVAVEVALTDPRRGEAMVTQNEEHPQWAPVLKRDLSLRDRARTPARAAVATLRRKPTDPDARALAVLESWGLEADPFAGGWQWHLTDQGWVGGADALLRAVVSCAAPWRPVVLKRLWGALLALPIGSRWEGDDAPARAMLRDGDGVPVQVKVLADALVDADLETVVVDAFPATAEDEAGERWQRWLAPWWCQHAKTLALGAFLQRECPAELVPRVLDAWLRRSDAGHRGVVAHALAERVGDLWLIARVEPTRILELPWSIETLSEAAGLPGVEHLPSLRKLRERGVR